MNFGSVNHADCADRIGHTRWPLGCAPQVDPIHGAKHDASAHVQWVALMYRADMD